MKLALQYIMLINVALVHKHSFDPILTSNGFNSSTNTEEVQLKLQFGLADTC